MRVPIIALSLLAATLVACGGDDAPASTAPTASAPATTATPTPTPTATGTPSPTPTAAAPANTAPREPEILKDLLDLGAAFRLVAMWGNGKNGVTFEGPNGLTIDSQGRVYVTEFQGARFRQFSPDGEVLMEVGSQGTGPSQFSQPIGIAVDANGSIFVSEAGNSRVQRFNADGEFVTAWGSPGTLPGQFFSAMGIAVSEDGKVFVADFGNHRVQVFDRDGELLRSWGSLGTGPGQFNNPIGLQIGPQGNVWVVDSGNIRVQTFTADGELIQVWNNVGSAPQIISLNAAGDFFVSSPAINQVRHYAADGKFFGYLGLGISPADSLRLNEDERSDLNPLTELAAPHGTGTDSAGVMYLADTRNNVVRRFIPVEAPQ